MYIVTYVVQQFMCCHLNYFNMFTISNVVGIYSSQNDVDLRFHRLYYAVVN